MKEQFTGVFSEKDCDNLYLSGSKSGNLYELGKIHKALEDVIPLFCPILSAIGTTIYKLVKLCDKLLKPITFDEYTLIDWFSFAEEVEEFAPCLGMASSDVK